jgi:hypothetical protein
LKLAALTALAFRAGRVAIAFRPGGVAFPFGPRGTRRPALTLGACGTLFHAAAGLVAERVEDRAALALRAVAAVVAGIGIARLAVAALTAAADVAVAATLASPALAATATCVALITARI